MKILYIGTPVNYQLWKEGKNPSHWLYGACEMEEEGHEVIWAKDAAVSGAVYAKQRPCRVDTD